MFPGVIAIVAGLSLSVVLFVPFVAVSYRRRGGLSGGRVLLWLAFVPSGLEKLLGIPFTTLPRTDPVGAYLGALYDTGWYYNAIGAAQLLAGIAAVSRRG